MLNKLTHNNICKKGECKLCGNSSKTDTVCIVATDKGGRIHIKLTLNDKSLVEGDISGPGTRSICSRKNPIPNVEEICIIPKDVDIAKLHSCLDVSVKVKKTTISTSIGCFTIPKKNFLDRIVGEGDISINDISSILSFDASPETVDDDIYGSTICHKGICRMCKTYKHHEACVIAKALHNGMEVKVVSSKFVLVQGKITNNTDVSFCKQYPELKAICIVAWNISLRNMSACVNISVQPAWNLTCRDTQAVTSTTPTTLSARLTRAHAFWNVLTHHTAELSGIQAARATYTHAEVIV
ncbi:uncharacterized protein LOC128221122 isoform X5 [Mya arenaria]|uniref:uncharacterized protein LOC128221122 isoform X5 n=1 Tax=Mya arenaria TaxID=6604 RepID=UPI0022E4236D|nr:uncharacterized protein LOC128221122 isoform X5 [Mya arenaria]